MDQKKIGAFLRTLRKEKGLTQETLAEQFHVSNRSISRWETGTSMPDLSLLVELAEFYHVEIREILDGERKREKMNPEEKETLLKVADYSENERNVLDPHHQRDRTGGLAAGAGHGFLPIGRDQSPSYVYGGDMLWPCGWRAGHQHLLHHRRSCNNQNSQQSQESRSYSAGGLSCHCRHLYCGLHHRYGFITAPAR